MTGFEIKTSDAKKPLSKTIWQNCERETIATNILSLAKFFKGDSWEPFTWEDYVKFCSHEPSTLERGILDEFVKNGFLLKDTSGTYIFTRKIIGVYMMHCD